MRPKLDPELLLTDVTSLGRNPEHSQTSQTQVLQPPEAVHCWPRADTAAVNNRNGLVATEVMDSKSNHRSHALGDLSEKQKPYK